MFIFFVATTCTINISCNDQNPNTTLHIHKTLELKNTNDPTIKNTQETTTTTNIDYDYQKAQKNRPDSSDLNRSDTLKYAVYTLALAPINPSLAYISSLFLCNELLLWAFSEKENTEQN